MTLNKKSLFGKLIEILCKKQPVAKFLTLILLNVLSFSITGITQSNEAFLANLKGHFTSLKSPTNLTSKLPYYSIEVIDSRFDSSKLGYLKKGDQYYKVMTNANFQSYCQSYLNRHYLDNLDKSTNQSLILIIKHLWLQETTDAEESNEKTPTQNDAFNNLYSQVYAVIEVYSKTSDSYSPIFRLDTTIKRNKYLQKISDELTALPFAICMDRLAEKTVANQKQSKLLSWSEIADYNNNRTNYSIFSDAGHPVKGVYLKFSDFLNNRPVYKNFETTFGKTTDELFIIEDGKKTLLEKFWGFSDGVKYFIRIDYSFFELIKDNKTFSFWGSKGIVHHHRQITAPTLNILSSKIRNNYRPLQINMETGLVY